MIAFVRCLALAVGFLCIVCSGLPPVLQPLYGIIFVVVFCVTFSLLFFRWFVFAFLFPGQVCTGVSLATNFVLGVPCMSRSMTHSFY